jgi:hypothetical protein
LSWIAVACHAVKETFLLLSLCLCFCTLFPHHTSHPSLPPGQRYAPPLEQPQLAALARLGAKKATDRKAWLEALTAPLAAAGSSQPLPVPGASAEPGAAAGNGVGSSDSSVLAGSGVEVSGLLGIVRGRVLPAPHLAYQQPECCYPGSQVRSPCVKCVGADICAAKDPASAAWHSRAGVSHSGKHHRCCECCASTFL